MNVHTTASPSSSSRRRFLSRTIAAAGSAPLAALPLLRAAPGEVASTDHFWYRLAPEGPYIDSQRGHQAFGFDQGTIYLSFDHGRTWPNRAAFPEADDITFSCILKNGNLLFATANQLYLSKDHLKTIHPLTVQDSNGNDYRPHQPANPSRPGWYFHPLDGVHTWEVNGAEMLVWGNYGNVLGGPVPENIYYSIDGGETVKIAYSFGQNPRFQEPGADPENYLGDPKNPVICRHIHSVSYHAEEDAFYACTGDIDRGHGHECHWLRGEYDLSTDSWTWEVLVSVNSNSRFKSGGISFVNGEIYWAADANGPKLTPTHDRGIFRCAPEDLTKPQRHTLLFNPEYESANMIIENDFILSAHYAPASPYHTGFIVSPDLGRSWAQYDLKEFGKRSPVRLQAQNSEGWFRVDLRKGWIERGEVLYLKPKL